MVIPAISPDQLAACRNAELAHRRSICGLPGYTINNAEAYEVRNEGSIFIIRKVGKKMLDDPEMGSDFIQPLKLGGAGEMGDSVIRR